MSIQGSVLKSFMPKTKTIVTIAIVIVIIAIIALIIYYVHKKIQEKKESKEFDKTKELAGDEYAALQDKGNTLSAKPIEFQQVSNAILTNLSGCDSLSSELKVIDDITKVVKKPIDWYYLVKIFGVKKVDDCGWGATTYALPELLKDQLDTGGIYSGLGGGIGSGVTSESINLLTDYLKKIGVTL